MFKNTINDARELAALLRPNWPTISARIDASGVPTASVATDDASLKKRLDAIEEQLGEARDERVVLNGEAAKAKSEYVKKPDAGPSSAVFKRAQKAAEELADCEERIKSLEKTQVGILKMGDWGRSGRGRRDQNGPRSGDYSAGDGWSHAAQALDLAGGVTRVDMPGRDLMRAPLASGFNVSPGESLTAPAVTLPFMQQAADRRLLYPVFPRGEVEQGDLALTEFRQVGSRSVSGEIERDPVATTPEKASLELSLELVTPSLRQWAAVINEVPSKLFESIPVLQAWLESELRYQLDLGVDAHCLSQIANASPPSGSEGTTLIEKARNGVAAMRGLGANPTVLALDPTDAAALDVQTTGSEGLEQYIFASRDTGSASPLWGATIVEVPNLEAPMLIDPALLAVLYAATGTMLVDPFSGLDTNEVRVRVEVDGLLHVRDISGAYVIAAPEEEAPEE